MNRLAIILALVGGVAVVSAQAPVDQPRFDIASVRPNTGSDLSIPFGPVPPDGIALVNRPLESIIRSAYALPTFRIVGMPKWAQAERFDISAKAARPITEAERRLMLQSLLRERFGLTVHSESREQRVYVMTRVRPDGALGPGMRPRLDCGEANKCSGGGSGFPAAGRAKIAAITLDQLASGMLSSLLGAGVHNESNTQGTFDVELSWRPEVAAGPNVDPNDARPAFLTAVQEQLGLTLSPERRPVEVLVIDLVERPTPD